MTEQSDGRPDSTDIPEAPAAVAERAAPAVALNPGAAVLTLDLPATQQTATAIDLEQCIRNLARIRAAMSPPVAPVPPLNELSDASIGLSAYVGERWLMSTHPDRFNLCFRHSGLGWVWILATREELERLARDINVLLERAPLQLPPELRN